MTDKLVTTQLTSKHLKFHIILSRFFIYGGILGILVYRDETDMVGWFSLTTLYGICHLIVTRMRIWWNHK